MSKWCFLDNKLFIFREIPFELKLKYPQGLSMATLDLKSEEMKLPEIKKQFSGSGTKMCGCPIGKCIHDSPIKTGKVDLNASVVVVDKSKPITKLRIRLHNGK